MTDPSRLTIHLLGGFEVTTGDGRPVRISTRKARALLACLAMRAAQQAAREELASLLWEDCTEQQARQSLRQVLLTLRKELPDAGLLLADSNRVWLAQGRWEPDAPAFERLASSDDLRDLATACALFKGTFLAGFHLREEAFEAWLAGERRRVEAAAARLCRTLAEHPALVLDGVQALSTVERLLAVDPLREDWQRIALQLYLRHAGGDEALAQGRRFAETLRRELDVAPEPATQAILQSIRDGAGASAGEMVERGRPAPALATGPEPDVPSRHRGPLRLRSLLPAGRRAVAASLVLLGLLLGAAAVVLGVGPRPPGPPPGAPATQASAPDPWQPPAMSGSSGRRQASRGRIRSILVLPFTSFGDSAAQAKADMLTDDLINLLSRVSSLRVLSRQTSLSFRGQTIDVGELGAELQVHYVLDGTLRRTDGGVRVNVELVDTRSRSPVWSTRIDREDIDRSKVLDEIVARLTRELGVEITHAVAAQVSANPDVHELVYRAWSAHNAAGRGGAEALRRAEAAFRQVLERDPGSVQGRLGLGAFHANMGAQVLDEDPSAHLTEAEAILTPLVRDHPDLASAHYFLGLVHSARQRLQTALQSFERAAELNPSHAAAYAHIGHALARMGRREEGLEFLDYALRLSPRDPVRAYWLQFRGNALIGLKRDEEAISSFRRSNELHKTYPRSLAGLAAAYALTGRMEEARAYAEKLRQAIPPTSVEQMLERFGGAGARPSRLREGLRVALTTAS
jgi:TolB-like protein/DNA-binding SARP family transcriptional activator